MAILEAGPHTAGFLISDNLYNSREEGIVDTLVALDPGSFVTKEATQGIASGIAGEQNAGDATIGSVDILPAAQSGVYVATFTSASAFDVTDPNGDAVASGTIGVEFSNQITFTITAGTDAPETGDTFLITVDVTKFNYVASTVASSIDGILFEGISGNDIDMDRYLKRTVIVRNAEVQLSELKLGAFNQSAVIARLNSLGIAVRIH